MAEQKKKKRRGPRRFNGTGCVYKQSGRRKEPWVARIKTGVNEKTGKPIFAYTFHETSADASNAIPEMQKKCSQNPRSEETVEQVWERFKAVRYPKLSETTKTGYNASYSHWQEIADKRIADLTTNDLQKIINKKSDMSYSHLTKMRALMVAIFNMAAKDDIVKRNYASLIELPKGEPESDRRSFTEEELLKIKEVAALGSVPYADVILFMCYTGWRPSEMCLLTKDSVDTEKWFITGGIKTDAGKNRNVPIHTTIRPIVSHWLGKNHKTLFADEGGRPLNKDKWGVRFRNAMKQVFQDVSVVPYTTRHTCASLLHAAGADHLSIAKIMGHKDYKITADIYTHPDLQELKAAIDAVT